MREPWQLSNIRLGVLYVAALVLGAQIVLLGWGLSEGRKVWGPALGAFAMLCLSFVVLLSAKSREQQGNKPV